MEKLKFLETMTINEFKSKMGVSKIEVKQNPHTGKCFFGLKEMFVRNSEERTDEPQEHIHRHCFDIRSSKVFSLLVGMGVVCTLSIWGNIELWKSKRQYADDALKFRVAYSGGYPFSISGDIRSLPS